MKKLEYQETWILYPEASGSHCRFLSRGGTSASQLLAEEHEAMLEASVHGGLSLIFGSSLVSH